MAEWPAGSDPSFPPAEGGDSAPGLGEQFGRTRSAFFGLIGAHVRLAQAELSEIGDQLKQVALLAALAFGLLFLAGVTLVVGLILWLDEWAFGSIGWGVLHGPSLLIALAVVALLAIVDLGWKRAGAALLVAAGFGVAAAAVLCADWQRLGGSGVGPSWLPALAAGLAIFGLLCLALGAFVGGARGAFYGILLGAFLGALFGLSAAAHPSLQIGAAVGLAVGLLALPIWAAMPVFRHGVDMDKLKARFWPTQTIETTKETIEWVREQMPLGRKS